MSVDQTQRPIEIQDQPHDSPMDVLRILSDARVAATRIRRLYYDRLWIGHYVNPLADSDHRRVTKLGLATTFDSTTHDLSSAKMLIDIPLGPIQGEHRISGDADVWRKPWSELDSESQLAIGAMGAYISQIGLTGIEDCTGIPLAELQVPFSESVDRRFANLSMSVFRPTANA